MARIEQFIGQISKEYFTPQTLGSRLSSVFEGYNSQGAPSEQMTFLLRHSLVHPDIGGRPIYTLNISGWERSNIFYPWEESTAQTREHTANSPKMNPYDLDDAFEAITVTNTHHLWNQCIRHEKDILITRNMSGLIINSFWYNKEKSPVQPWAMIKVYPILPLLIHYEHPQTSIQLWQINAQEQTYELQAALYVQNISLRQFLHVLTTSPADLL